MGDKVFSFLTLFVVVAILTTLVLPGRGTAGIIKETLGGFTNWTTASIAK